MKHYKCRTREFQLQNKRNEMKNSADEMLEILEQHEDCPNTQTMVGQYEDCELCGLPSFCHEY